MPVMMGFSAFRGYNVGMSSEIILIAGSLGILGYVAHIVSSFCLSRLKEMRLQERALAQLRSDIFKAEQETKRHASQLKSEPAPFNVAKDLPRILAALRGGSLDFDGINVEQLIGGGNEE